MSKSPQTPCHDRVAALALIGLTLAFFAWQITHLDGFRWDYDEGPYMMAAKLVHSGHRLYSEVYSAQPPLFIASIAGAFTMLGPSAQAARAVMVVYSTIGLLATALLARELGGWLAGLSAALLLALAPDFFIYSRACIGDIPSMSMAALAILMALYHRRWRQRRWLALSGLALSAGLLLKLLPLLVVPLLGLIVLLNRSKAFPRLNDRWPPAMADLVWLGLPCLLSSLWCLLAYDFRPMCDQVIGFWLQARAAFRPDLASNGQKIVTYLAVLNGGILSLAAYGLWATFAKRPAQALVMALWLIFTALGLANHAPLWPHLLTAWLFPLAILAGMAVSDLVHRLKVLGSEGSDWSQAKPLLVGLCAMLVYLSTLPATIELDGRLLAAPTSAEDLDAVRFLKAVTAPADCVIADEQLIPFWADRDVPPPLTDTSFKRMFSGRLTAHQLIAMTQEYEAKAIVFWSDGRFADHLPDYLKWVRTNYRLARRYDSGAQIYLPVEPSAHGGFPLALESAK
ncbi:MAG TPA: phospholipid carrier-dependent glycosyltransferase [Anaerolineae bacterium]|nr:phospholipid carrier-dependent glycosyltransferase [Anaerolineae bacterium]